LTHKEAHSLALSILSISWAHAFCPPFDAAQRTVLQRHLLWLGEWVDKTSPQFAMKTLAEPEVRAKHVSGVEEPKILIDGRDMLVLCKPPGWEVDSVANETDALSLSGYLQ